MRLSRTFTYAVQVVAFIANSKESVVVGHRVAKLLGVPEGFVLRIMVSLSKSGILRSIKGPNGGYTLAHKRSDVTLLDIAEAVEGPMRSTPPFPATNGVDRLLHKVYEDANETARQKFSRIKVSDLVKAV